MVLIIVMQEQEKEGKLQYKSQVYETSQIVAELNVLKMTCIFISLYLTGKSNIIC